MGGSPIAGYYGNKKRKAGMAAADAAGRSAYEREQEARTQKKQGLAEMDKRGKAEIAATKSVEELNSLSSMLQANDRQLQRDETLISNIDPTIMEASTQALKLLRGEKADALAPMEAQRQTQRQTLINSLRAQFGPGAESSSIGQNALQKFDAETQTLASQTQQNSLSQLLGTTMQGRGMAQTGIQSGVNNIAGAAGQYGNIAARTATATGNSAGRYANFLTGANANVLNAAGSQHVGTMLSNQASQQYYTEKQASAQQDHNVMMGFMTSMGMSGMTGGGGGGGGGTQGTASAGSSYKNYGNYA